MKDAAADGTYQKGGAGVVAERQQTLGLPRSDGAAGFKLGDIGSPCRIAAAETHRQGGSPGAADPVESHGGGSQQSAEQPR